MGDGRRATDEDAAARARRSSSFGGAKLGRFVSLGRVDGSSGARERGWGRGFEDAGANTGARYEEAGRGYDDRDRRGYGDDYGRDRDDHYDRRRSYDAQGRGDFGGYRSERSGYGFRDRDDGFGRRERASPDRERDWRRREDPEPVVVPQKKAPEPAPRARRSLDVNHNAEGALDKFHIPHGANEWGQEDDDFVDMAPPSWLLQDTGDSSRATNRVPAPRRAPAVQPNIEPKTRDTGHFSSAKLPEHLKHLKREPGEEKKLWTPPEPIGGIKKRADRAPTTHPKPAPVPKAASLSAIPEPKAKPVSKVLPEPKTRGKKAEVKVAPKTPQAPRTPPSVAKSAPVPPPVPPVPPVPAQPEPSPPRVPPPVPPGKPPHATQPPLPPTPPPPLPPGAPPGTQPPLPAGQPPLPPMPPIAKLSISALKKNSNKKKAPPKKNASSGVTSSSETAEDAAKKPKAKPAPKLKKTSAESSQGNLSSNGASKESEPKSKPKAKSKALSANNAQGGPRPEIPQKGRDDDATRRESLDASRAQSKVTI